MRRAQRAGRVEDGDPAEGAELLEERLPCAWVRKCAWGEQGREAYLAGVGPVEGAVGGAVPGGVVVDESKGWDLVDDSGQLAGVGLMRNKCHEGMK